MCRIYVYIYIYILFSCAPPATGKCKATADPCARFPVGLLSQERQEKGGEEKLYTTQLNG